MIRDIVQSAGLVVFAEFGLIMFCMAFFMIVLRTFVLTSNEEHEAARYIPLGEEEAHAKYTEYAEYAEHNVQIPGGVQ